MTQLTEDDWAKAAAEPFGPWVGLKILKIVIAITKYIRRVVVAAS